MKFYGQFKLDEILYNKYFPNHKNGFFVECGAFDGVVDSTCKFFEESMGWSGINIEPLPHIFNKLVQNRPNSFNFNCALSNYEYKTNMKQVILPKIGDCGLSSIKHTDVVLKDLVKRGCTFKDLPIRCRTFKSIVNELKDKMRPIDLFVLDVEGHELQALNGILSIDKTLLPKIFCIEHTMVGLDKLNNKLPNYKLLEVNLQNAFYGLK